MVFETGLEVGNTSQFCDDLFLTVESVFTGHVLVNFILYLLFLFLYKNPLPFQTTCARIGVRTDMCVFCQEGDHVSTSHCFGLAGQTAAHC